MIKLYGFAVSNYYNMVKMVLIEKGMEFEEVTVRPSQESEYLSRSPMGKVPCIETEQGFLTETEVIIDYLDSLGLGPSFYPVDPFERAKVRELIRYLELYIELPARRLYGDVFFGRPASEAEKESVNKELVKGFAAHTALVHADSHTPELSELIVDLADRTETGAVFGGLASSRGDVVQFARSQTDSAPKRGQGVYSGGLSGVAFSPSVAMLTRVTQGCLPFGEIHQITSAKEHVVLTLDDAPALYTLMQALHVPIDNPRSAVDKVRETLVGLSLPDQAVLRATGGLDDAAMVRHIIGLDPVRHGVAVAHAVSEGMQLVFCKRDAASAKADLLRMATEIRESLEPLEAEAEPWVTTGPSLGMSRQGRRIAGAIYISCTGRGGSHFGAPNAELNIIRRALGDVPLVGFLAAGEIANQQIYGYTGVLTVFTTP
jgi:small ligand-binding sensory domain FIST